MSNYTAREMKRLMGKAIHTREMIQEGDHVMVAVSGGKDSMSLLWLLRERIKRIPIDYRITAVHVDPGFGADSASRMEAFFSDHGFEYHVLKSEIGPKAHGPENRENPCFLCSRLRRTMLFQLADKIHHKPHGIHGILGILVDFSGYLLHQYAVGDLACCYLGAAQVHSDKG